MARLSFQILRASAVFDVIKIIYTVVILTFSSSLFALPIRTFVAVPLAPHDLILRALTLYHIDTDILSTNGSIAYGFGAKHAIFITYPDSLRAVSRNPSSNISALYRYLAYSNNRLDRAFRIGLLAGSVIPTTSKHHGAITTGFVSTFFKNRNQLDFDALYSSGIDNTKNSARYDISWQYRLFPNLLPEWGLPIMLNSVIEYNGRWTENQTLIHQTTIGLQLLAARWLVEAALVQNLNVDHDSMLLLSLRLHF